MEIYYLHEILFYLCFQAKISKESLSFFSTNSFLQTYTHKEKSWLSALHTFKLSDVLLTESLKMPYKIIYNYLTGVLKMVKMYVESHANLLTWFIWSFTLQYLIIRVWGRSSGQNNLISLLPSTSTLKLGAG